MKIKNVMLGLIGAMMGVGALAIAAQAPATIPNNDLALGLTGATNKILEFNLTAPGASTNPKIRWNNSSSALEFSNDGTTFTGIGGGGGTPGGSNTQIQYNNSSAFGGDSTFIFNNSTKLVTAQALNLSGGTASRPLILDSSKNLAEGTYSGNTTEFATASGSLTNGHCVSIDASGNFVDNGSACGTGGGGGVTSVGLAMPSIFTVSGSPILSSGTLTAALNVEGANLIFAGPGAAPSATPTFRALVGADLPNPSVSALGGVQSAAAVTHQWINSISTSGVPALSQPAYSDLSGTPTPYPASVAQTTKGDLITYSTLPIRHAVPADGGSLVADSAQTDGWRNASYIQLSGKPGKNYIQYASFENGATTGWTATGCATITNGLPACVGTGAAAFSSSNGGRTKNANTNAPAIDTSSALAGVNALNLATTGAGAIGDGYVSSAYTIDAEDQAKVLSFKLYYKVVSGTPVMSGTSANTYAVAAYDVANNLWFNIAGAFSLTQSTGQGYATGTFQTAANTTAIQFFIYSPVAPTGTSSLLVDDIFVGPQTAPYGPVITDWKSYTPTFGAGLGTVTSPSYFWRRVGSTLEITGQAITGTVATGLITISLPSGIAVDTSVLGSSGSIVGQQTFGSATTPGAMPQVGPMLVLAATPTVLTMTNVVTGGAFNNFAGANGSSLYANTQTFTTMAAGIPIAGWSSNVQMSNDTDTRVIEMRASATPTTVSGSIASGTAIMSFGTAQEDTSASYNATTGVYTVPVSGRYVISVSAKFVATSAFTVGDQGVFTITKNGTGIQQVSSYAGSSTAVAIVPSGMVAINCNAGDTITIIASSPSTFAGFGGGTGINWLSIFRLSGPSVIAATESVNMKYANTAGTSISNSGGDILVPFATKVYDSHNAFNTSTGIYTVPVSGKYRVSASMTFAGAVYAVGNFVGAGVYKNGSLESYGPLSDAGTTTSVNIPAPVTTTVQCNAGDTLNITVANGRTAGSTSLITSAGYNHVEIERVGN